MTQRNRDLGFLVTGYLVTLVTDKLGNGYKNVWVGCGFLSYCRMPYLQKIVYLCNI